MKIDFTFSENRVYPIDPFGRMMVRIETKLELHEQANQQANSNGQREPQNMYS
jgi:hypothetical protein